MQQLSHVGLYVTDIKRSVDFYTRVLGLNLLEQYQNKNTGREIAFLGVDAPVLELLSPANVPDPENRPPRGRFDHLAWYVEDIEGIVSRLTGMGIEFNPREIMTVLDGRKIAFFSGPDGERLELVQRA